MKILINRKPVKGPWGGGNLFVTAFCDVLREKGHEVVHEISENIDIIFLQDPRYSDLGISINEVVAYKNKFPGVKIFHRVNECDARKGTEGIDNLLRYCSQFTDKTIFVSNWIMNYHNSKGWLCDNQAVVYNGVNKDHFRQTEKIENGKVNIVTHHWSNNRLKGFDVYDFLDDFVSREKDFTFTYIGRENGNFKNTKVISPLFGKDLGNELGKYDVYVSASRFDPGPNHILESLSCQIPTFSHAEGGGAVEFTGTSHSFKEIEELVEILKNKNFKKNKNVAVPSWKDCIENYCLEMGL